MKAFDPLGTLIAELEKEMDRITSMVMSGSCPDYVSYREMVANHKAIAACVEAIQKVFSGDDEEGD